MQRRIEAAFLCGMLAAGVAAGSVLVVPNVAAGFGLASAIGYGVGHCFCTRRAAKNMAMLAALLSMVGSMAALVSSMEGRVIPCENNQTTTESTNFMQINDSCSIEQVPGKVAVVAVSICCFVLSTVFSLLAIELQIRSDRRRLINVIV